MKQDIQTPIFRSRTNPNQTHIGERMRYYRELRSITLDELATKTAINKNTLNHYESGVVTSPPIKNLQKICIALRIQWADILPPVQ